MWQRRPLGHGIGLRSTHFADILEHGVGDVGWFEVISENFFTPGGRPWAVLERVRREAPVVLHGVSLAIGNTEALSESYLSALQTLIDRIEPAWVSDHLCWGGHGGHYAHDLLPLPFTEEALAHVVGRVEQVQERLGRRILLENVSSYLRFTEDAMSEWEFLSEIARRADCGLLLDVNNVFVNATNHGFSAERFIDSIPADRVGQIHVAGHTDRGSYLLDSHIGPVPAPVWALYRRAIARLGPVPTIIEWDEQIPALEVVWNEACLAQAHEREVCDGR